MVAIIVNLKPNPGFWRGMKYVLDRSELTVIVRIPIVNSPQQPANGGKFSVITSHLFVKSLSVPGILAQGASTRKSNCTILSDPTGTSGTWRGNDRKSAVKNTVGVFVFISPKTIRYMSCGRAFGKLVSLNTSSACAVTDLIDWLRGSFFASSISSFQASAKPRTTSAAIPNIKTRQPHFAIHFRRLKTLMFLESFSAIFSIQSPQKTIKPPIDAIIGQIQEDETVKGFIFSPWGK